MKAGLAALILGAWSAGGAAASCPTSADLDAGITILSEPRAQRPRYVVKRVAGDLIWNSQVNRMFPDPWSTYKHGGFFQLYTQKESGAAKSVTTFDAPLPDMATFLSEGGFTAHRQWGPPDGSQVWAGTFTYTVEAADPVEIGACTYDTVFISYSGKTTYPTGEVRTISRMERYVPELAFNISGSQPYEVRLAEWGDGVLGWTGKVAQAAWTPALRDILNRYGALP